MKKRTRFIATRNYSLLKMKQLMKSLRHSLRISTTLSMNINQERIKNNKVEMLDIRNFMNNNEENYISLNYELNKLQTDLTYILEFKNVVTIDEITKILNKGTELLREIKNVKISQNQVELIRYMLSNAKKIEIEKSNKIYDNDNDILNDEDISTNQEEKKLSKKSRIKKAREEIYQLQKEQLLEDINSLDDEQKNKLLFEMEQLESIENMIKLMTKENIKDDEKPQDLVKLRESIKSTKKALEDKKMNMSLENFDKFYDENIEDKTDEEIATEYINLNWDNSKYKEHMNDGFKKRTIESLIKYTTIKDKKRNMNKDEIVSGTKTIVQELMFKPIADGIKMTIEELTELQNKIKEEEKSKGNFVFASMIHDDEGRCPHIHLFIMSKTMNILNNQVNFINEKYQTTFNSYNSMKKEEQKKFGVKQQDHYYELINSVITQDKKFVRKHIVDTTQIDLIKDEKMKQEAIEQKDLIRKSNNLLIKARNRESINKREFNNINNDIEKNIEKFEMINLEFIDKENKLENRKTKYQKELQREKQKMQQDYEDMKSKLQNKFNEQLQSKKQELEKENQKKLDELKTEQTKKIEDENKVKEEGLKSLRISIDKKYNKFKQLRISIKKINENIECHLKEDKEFLKEVVENVKTLEIIEIDTQYQNNINQNKLRKLQRTQNNNPQPQKQQEYKMTEEEYQEYLKNHKELGL